MLSQVSGNHNKELIESIKIGDLSMRSKDITVDNLDQSELLEQPDSSPIRSFTTARELCYLRLLRIYGSIISPQSQKSECYFSLSYCQAKRMIKAFPDKVKLLKEQAR